MAYAFVQAVKNSANSNVLSITPTAGNLLLLLSRTSSGGGTPTVTGMVTNNSTALSSRIATFENLVGRWCTIFELVNVPSGVTSVTVTYNGGTPGTTLLLGVEYSGLATTTPFIAANSGNYQAAPGTTANAITSGAVNVTSQPALVLGAVMTWSGNSDATAGTGYTNRFSADNDFLIMDKRITATGNNTVTATAASHGGTDAYETFLLAYAEAGAGGTSAKLLSMLSNQGGF